VQDLGLLYGIPIILPLLFKDVPVNDDEVGIFSYLQASGPVLLPHYKGTVDGSHLYGILQFQTNV
jgi:hypothetical protein